MDDGWLERFLAAGQVGPSQHGKLTSQRLQCGLFALILHSIFADNITVGPRKCSSEDVSTSTTRVPYRPNSILSIRQLSSIT